MRIGAKHGRGKPVFSFEFFPPKTDDGARALMTTVADLRRVYEAVWGSPLDPRNFHRKVTGTPGFLVPVGRPAPVGRGGGRPAALFTRGDATALRPAMLRHGG